MQVHLVERIPFFDALYFVTTTLTTVGYGDVVVVSPLGKAAVLAMILVGVVLIPVQTSQLYSQLTARRLTLGALDAIDMSRAVSKPALRSLQAPSRCHVWLIAGSILGSEQSMILPGRGQLAKNQTTGLHFRLQK